MLKGNCKNKLQALFLILSTPIPFIIHGQTSDIIPNKDWHILYPGIGFDSVKVGITTKEDIIRIYGNSFKTDTFYSAHYDSKSDSIVTSKERIHSIRLSYENLGMSFYFHPYKKAISSINVHAPFNGMTKDSIVLNESTFKDVVNKYGKTAWSIAGKRKMLDYGYDGITFYDSFNGKFTKSEEERISYLDEKVTEIGIKLNPNKLEGSIRRDIEKVLKTNDFIAFKKFSEKLQNSTKGITIYPTSMRDITMNHQEGVYDFKILVPESDNPAISTEYSYRIKLITFNTQIIYYSFCKKRTLDHNDFYFYGISDNKNDSLFNELKSSFRTIFSAELNENELFIDSIVYGENCGWAGTPIKESVQINEWVKNRDKDKLLSWLQSSNTEKQIYAVNGFYQLKKAGVPLSEKEIEIIKFVIRKNGTINVCSGCLYGKESIKDIVRKFKF